MPYNEFVREQLREICWRRMRNPNRYNGIMLRVFLRSAKRLWHKKILPLKRYDVVDDQLM